MILDYSYHAVSELHMITCSYVLISDLLRSNMQVRFHATHCLIQGLCLYVLETLKFEAIGSKVCIARIVHTLFWLNY